MKALLACALLCVTAAHAGQLPCVPYAHSKELIDAKAGSSWITLTTEQWRFLGGVYATNPLTPPGLPLGDRAIMVRVPEDRGDALILFIDGDKICAEMPIPSIIVQMVMHVGNNDIFHEGQAN